MRYTTRNGEEIAIDYINGEIRIDGGQGSGNFGHAGRKGQRGGSAKESDTTPNYSEEEAIENITDTLSDIMENYSPSARSKITKAIDNINNAEDSEDIFSIIDELYDDVLFNYRDATTLTNVVNKLK